MCKFYDPWGKEFNSKEDFVKFYNRLYFNDCKYKLSGIFQNSRYVEEEMDNLLKNGIENNRDVVHILAWKIGKIKHADSTKENPFVYHKDWNDAKKWEGKEKSKEDFNVNDLKIYRYKAPFDLSKLILCIVDDQKEGLKSELKEMVYNNKPQEILNTLVKEAPKGVGTVYLITLLYFISKGEYPIYDRFADIALNAISLGKSPATIVKPICSVTLPSKPPKDSNDTDNTPFGHVVECNLIPFKEKINNIFGYDNYKDKRDIDRALWVYGHLFSSETIRKLKRNGKIITKEDWKQNKDEFYQVS